MDKVSGIYGYLQSVMLEALKQMSLLLKKH